MLNACRPGDLCRLLAITGFWLASGSFVLAESFLSPRNPEVPFPYLCGETREWPILEQPLPAGNACGDSRPNRRCSPE